MICDPNSQETIQKPVQVVNLAHVIAIAIAAGRNHSIALKSNGTVWTWGVNNNGQLGDGLWAIKYIPSIVESVSDIVSIAAGGNNSAILNANGQAWACGENLYGQLGNSSSTDERTPIQISTATDIRSIAIGNNHILVLKKEGDVWASGRNTSGQLGDNTQTNRDTAVQVVGLFGVDYLNLLMVSKDIPVTGLKYMITDAEGGVLTMTGVSYNTGVLPENTMDMGESGVNPYTDIYAPSIADERKVELVPGVGKVGTASFVCGISDSSGLTAFNLIKLSVNDVPEMSAIDNQVININETSIPIPFTVNDAGTAISELVIASDSTYTILVSLENISITGTTSNRSCTITPSTDESGSTCITLTISDGNASFSRSFTVTINTAPDISTILPQVTLENLSLNLVFSLTDTVDGIISLTCTSSGAQLVQSDGFQFTHPLMIAQSYTITISDSIPENMTLTISPTEDEYGQSSITITLTDAYGLTASESFMLSVIKASSKSIELDGLDDHAISQEIFTLEPTEAVTVEAWIFLYTNTGDLAVMTYGNTITESITFEHRNHNLDLRLRNDNNTDFASVKDIGASGFPIDVWHHVCATWDNTSNKGYLYKNGSLLYSDTFSSDTIGYSGTRKLYIGSWFGLSKFFKGKIDDIRIWKTALTREIINAWKYKQVTVSHPNFDQLVAYYPFSAVSGEKVFDIHNNHHAYLFGPLRSLYIPFDNWLDTGSNNWNAPANWESELVPIDSNPGFTVINAGIRIPLLTAPSSIQNLVLTQGATFSSSEANPLTIYGKLIDSASSGSIDIGGSITVMGACDFKTDRIAPVSDVYTITTTTTGDDINLRWRKATDDQTTELLYAVVMSDYTLTCVDTLAHIAENISPCHVETAIPFQAVSGSGSGEVVRSAGGDDVEVDVLDGSGKYFNVLVRDEMFNIRVYNAE